MNSVCNGLCALYTVSTAPRGSPSSTTVWQWLWRPVFYHPGTHIHIVRDYLTPKEVKWVQRLIYNISIYSFIIFNLSVL